MQAKHRKCPCAALVFLSGLPSFFPFPICVRFRKAYSMMLASLFGFFALSPSSKKMHQLPAVKKKHM
jgi:hypothetical protein